ncbi:hypothetical protein NST04_29005 [Paenibacillus sp. FSL H7-0756]|uniref:hypothetical protein n=1 Tax=Paenibacillus sp. FSL H7-0756 TaxID=2954738 RepID=UPI0030F90F2A
MKRLKIILMFLLILSCIPLAGVSAATSVSTGPGETKTYWGDIGSEYIGKLIYTSGSGTASVYLYDKDKNEVYKNSKLPLGSYITGIKDFNIRYVKVTLSENSTLNTFSFGSKTTNLITEWTDYVDQLPSPSASPEPTATPLPTSPPSPTTTPTPTASPLATATPSPTPVPTVTPTPGPEQPSGDRALITITMVNGVEKEYDLSMIEVDAFLNWCDSRDAGRGPGMYAINKHSNNKGPFSKRTEYVIHDKILTFEVSEYKAQ